MVQKEDKLTGHIPDGIQGPYREFDMIVESAKLIYFSPTSTTKKTVEGVAQGACVEGITHIDLTSPVARTQVLQEMTGEELAVIGAPVYGGRLPEEAVLRLSRLRGNDTPAVIIVVYGNRAFDDALLELRDLSLTLGFRPVAGGAFIGEHSFSRRATPIAHGRPDEEDLRQAFEFGKSVRKKVESIPSLAEVPLLHVPGQFPYKALRPLSHTVVTQESLCTRCEACVKVCPTASITLNETIVTDSRSCIACCACIKECPVGARMMDDPETKRIAQWLSTNCNQPKKSEAFL
jgi:ferredoxin